MSISPVTQSNVAAVASNPPPQPANKQEELQSNSQAAAADTVQISSAGKAMQRALQEATETQAQTEKEARNGDAQARRLLAKEAAADERTEPSVIKAMEG